MTQIFFDPKFFSMTLILEKMIIIFDKFFLNKIFGLHFQLQNSLTINQMGFDTVEINLVLFKKEKVRL